MRLPTRQLVVGADAGDALDQAFFFFTGKPEHAGFGRVQAFQQRFTLAIAGTGRALLRRGRATGTDHRFEETT
jgi:hypothetical protein